MYIRVRELLTKDQRLEFTQIYDNLSEWELGVNFTFSNEDIEFINKHRRDYNRLGIAVQLCLLRYTGWPLTDKDDIPENVLKYIASQINVSYEEFSQYFIREATRFEHLEEIRQKYSYKNFPSEQIQSILDYTTGLAMENGQAHHLVRLTVEQLRRGKFILPAISTIERLVWEARKTAEDNIYSIITNSLTSEQKKKLDRLLETTVDKGKTKLV